MFRLGIFNVLLILPILTSAQSGCSFGGKSYSHLDTFTHANGCAHLQCQDGDVVTTYEACGKEFDRQCHAVNETFLFQRQTYMCTKNSTGDYEIDLAPPTKFNCTAEGRVFQDLEIFKLSEGCNDYQCQDGEVAAINPEACGKQLDGQCHLVDSWTLVSGKVYKCEKNVVDGKATYVYTEIKPQPDLSTTCRLSSKTYTNLEIFRNRIDQCDSRQCQNEDMPYLNRVCRFSQDNKKCYPVGQRWVYNERVFECTDVSGDSKAARAPSKFRNCTVGSITYQHLETFTTGNGCETSQCQSGEVKVIKSGCKDKSGQCVNPNHAWKEGTESFKCVYQEPGGYTVVPAFVGSEHGTLSNELPRTCRDVKSEEPRAVATLSDGLEVLCDTQTDGGGWIVIQRRVSSDVDFYRNWTEYKNGFGNITGNFWFGNENIHRLTFQRPYQLRVDLTFNNSDYFAVYSHFRVSGEDEVYQLDVSGYSGNANDSLRYHNGQGFTTWDRDNDENLFNCAQLAHGAWWYSNCHVCSLNGVWGSKDSGQGLNWFPITGYYDSVTSTEMKIRPVD